MNEEYNYPFFWTLEVSVRHEPTLPIPKLKKIGLWATISSVAGKKILTEVSNTGLDDIWMYMIGPLCSLTFFAPPPSSKHSTLILFIWTYSRQIATGLAFHDPYFFNRWLNPFSFLSDYRFHATYWQWNHFMMLWYLIFLSLMPGSLTTTTHYMERW